MDNEKNVFEPVLLGEPAPTPGDDGYGYTDDGTGSTGSSDESF